MQGEEKRVEEKLRNMKKEKIDRKEYVRKKGI